MTTIPDNGQIGPDQNAKRCAEQFVDARQERIWRRLQLVGPGPATFFGDSCRLMGRYCVVASKTHIVGHLLREIESALRDVLEPFAAQADVGDEQQCGKSSGSHADEIRSVLAALDIPEDDPGARTWLSLAGGSSGTALHRRAHREDLDFRRMDPAFEQWWEDVQSVLDAVLQRFEERFATVFETLDALLAGSMADVGTLKNHIPCNFTVHRYFFSKLDNPLWVRPLLKANMFSHPPDPEVVDAGAGVRFPGWPIVDYLERMAASHPGSHQDVLETVLSIPDTANVRVQHGLLRVSLRLLPALSKELVPKAIHWLEGPYRPLSGVEYAELVRHLAIGGVGVEALNLAAALYAISPDADRSEVDAAPLRLRSWDYEKSLELALPSLVEVAPLASLNLMSDLLEQAVVAGRGTDGGSGADVSGADLSVFWRPAIEDHEQNRERENLRGLLVTAVRDAAFIAASRQPNSVPELIAVLEARPPRVFQRISLHLLRVCPQGAPDALRAHLLDRSLFDDPDVVHEYYHLLHDCFRLLSADDQAVILGWVEEGLGTEDYIAACTEQQGNRPTEAQITDYCDFWRVKKLMPISEFLPEEWRQRFDQLVRRLGLPEHPDFPVYLGTWIGPTSPLTLEDIRAMEPGALIQHLRGWVPAERWGSPTPEGLGRLVTAAVADDPSNYTPAFEALSGIEATYVRSILEGIRQATDSKKTFDWGPALDLAEQVVHSSWPTPPSSGPGHDRDSDWRSTRKTIAAMIEAGLQSGVSEIPFSFREIVWQILEPLTDDPDPGPDDERRYGEGGFDAVSMSINTVRGRAMHAVVQYGLWAMRHAPQTQDGESHAPVDPAVAPEVWPVLDGHLDVTRDPSLAVRSVYGQWFPWIHLLSHDWATSRLDQIFPRGPEQAPWWTAVWIGYVMHTRPFDDVLPVLGPVYEHAVKLMSLEEEPRLFGDRPSERLGEHLAAYAWRGKISVDPIDSLLEGYWTNADAGLRRHVLGYIGRSLREWLPAEIDPGVPPALERLKMLWAFVLSQAGQPGNDEELNELSAFAWWFSSGRFDDDWAFDQLDLVLRKTSLLDEAHLVAERLVNAVDARPLRSVQVLDELVENDHEGWRITGWKDEVRKVLETAMRSADEGVQVASVRLINRLVSKGYVEFRDLMVISPGQGGDG